MQIVHAHQTEIFRIKRTIFWGTQSTFSIPIITVSFAQNFHFVVFLRHHCATTYGFLFVNRSDCKFRTEWKKCLSIWHGNFQPKIWVHGKCSWSDALTWTSLHLPQKPCGLSFPSFQSVWNNFKILLGIPTSSNCTKSLFRKPLTRFSSLVECNMKHYKGEHIFYIVIVEWIFFGG